MPIELTSSLQLRLSDNYKSINATLRGVRNENTQSTFLAQETIRNMTFTFPIMINTIKNWHIIRLKSRPHDMSTEGKGWKSVYIQVNCISWEWSYFYMFGAKGEGQTAGAWKGAACWRWYKTEALEIKAGARGRHPHTTLFLNRPPQKTVQLASSLR